MRIKHLEPISFLAWWSAMKYSGINMLHAEARQKYQEYRTRIQKAREFYTR